MSSQSLQKMMNYIVKGLLRGSIRLQGSSLTRYHQIFVPLLLVISPYLTSGAPTSASVSLSGDDALSTYYCSDSLTWSGPSFFPKNCATAVAMFLVEKHSVHEDMPFEFLAFDDHARSRYPSQRTPQKFSYGKLPVYIRQIYGRETANYILSMYLQEMADLGQPLTDTCTMAIVMLAAFYPGELPGVSPSRVFGLTDVASYDDAWNAVRQVMDNCISKYFATNQTIADSGGGMNFRSQTGWSAFGTLHLVRTNGKSVTDMGNAVQEAKVRSGSFYGTQVRI